jgi:hypothetical protein
VTRSKQRRLGRTEHLQTAVAHRGAPLFSSSSTASPLRTPPCSSSLSHRRQPTSAPLRPSQPIPELWYSATQLPALAACCLNHWSLLPPPVPHQPPSASKRMGHSGHPSAPSPPPRAPQPLRGPHRPPRRLPRPVVHLYRHCSPLLTHATVDGLIGEHPPSPCPSNWAAAPPPCNNTFSPPTSGVGLPESPTTVAAQRSWASRSQLPCFR